MERVIAHSLVPSNNHIKRRKLQFNSLSPKIDNSFDGRSKIISVEIIHCATAEQNSVAELMTQSITEIGSELNDIANIMDESAKTTNDLAQESHSLQDVVNLFKYK